MKKTEERIKKIEKRIKKIEKRVEEIEDRIKRRIKKRQEKRRINIVTKARMLENDICIREE